MRVKGFRRSVVAFTGLCVLALVGCGPTPGTISGKATLDGKPLKGGMITFHNKSGGRSATAEIAEDGSYTTSAFSGDYAVSVDTEYLNTATANKPSFQGSGTPPPAMMGGGTGGPPKGAQMGPKGGMPEGMKGYVASMPGDAQKRYMKIPEKYHSETSSGLTFSHPGGSQTYDIPLTGK